MKRAQLLILRIGETYWKTVGEFTSGTEDCVFSSGTRGHKMAIIVDGRYKHLVLNTMATNNQMAVVRIEAIPSTILLQMKRK